jgi:hypothetical protein
MAYIRFILFVTLFAAIVLAAPRPAQIQKRSFKVPRSLNKAHPRGLNGADAMRKVLQKYSLHEGFISNTKTKETLETLKVAASNTTKNGTGEVAANPEQNAALFLSPVDVGGQTLNLDFDSGSSDL